MDCVVRKTVREELLHRLSAGQRMLMGILNVTPDSFSDGGEHFGLANAVQHAEQMRLDGADIIDIGGESTRPGAENVDAAEEWRRVGGTIASLAASGALPVSIDTYKASVARQAADAGAVIINDVWGMTRDKDMARTVAETHSLIVVTYNRGTADASIALRNDMAAFFADSFAMAEAHGIPREHIILDPGVGFGKTYEQNFGVLANLDVLAETGCAVLVGVSRKSFIGRLTGNPVGDRLIGTLTANLDSLRRGASILRVHDVAAHREALTMLEAIEQNK
ncbi:dihydropteroate synthase [uncultured Hyphomonas sp.]|uniref:dihydropteroate synthase n=1 Tax=uncultured Hyphomonas sp. TaxID=225298 RepID=UPI002AAB6B85|nr:dihydropteroate synthase [uncultured Hyphomonas sp.]